jgi:hypothetical protein
MVIICKIHFGRKKRAPALLDVLVTAARVIAGSCMTADATALSAAAADSDCDGVDETVADDSIAIAFLKRRI